MALDVFSLNTIIESRGLGLNSLFGNVTLGLTSTITDTEGHNVSFITTKGVESLIGNTTLGLSGEFH